LTNIKSTVYNLVPQNRMEDINSRDILGIPLESCELKDGISKVSKRSIP